MDLAALSQEIPALVKWLCQQKSDLLNIFCPSRGFPPRMSPEKLLTFMHPVRADRSRIALHAARKSKNGIGWHFGFKPHIITNTWGELLGFVITR